MNLPNKLTVLRVLMIPLFLVLYFCNQFLWAFIIFALAALTDMLDGMIARKYNLVTDFGKLMDPLADKLLTIAAFICLLARHPLGDTAGLIMLIVIISRELIVTSIRLIAAEKGIVIAADKWGKLKTITQMVWICQELLLRGFSSIPVWCNFAGNILLAVVVALTVGSGINYILKNRMLLQDM